MSSLNGQGVIGTPTEQTETSRVAVRKRTDDGLFELLEEMKKTQDEGFAVKMDAIIKWRELVERAHRFKDSVDDIMQEISKETKPEEKLLETFGQFSEQFKLTVDQYIIGHAKLLKGLEFESTFIRKALELRQSEHGQPTVLSIPIKAHQEVSTSRINSSASSSTLVMTRTRGKQQRNQQFSTGNDASEVGTEEETAL